MREVKKFQIEDLSNIFKNINHQPCNSPGYDYSFSISGDGGFIGEIFYSNEDKELIVIKDNFPMPRKSYKTTFPIKTFGDFVLLMTNIGIKLIANCEHSNDRYAIHFCNDCGTITNGYS